MSYSILRYFGLFSMLLRIVLILFMVNIHIRLVSELSYRVFDYKYVVYLIILVYAVYRCVKFNSLIYFNGVFRLLIKDSIIIF